MPLHGEIVVIKRNGSDGTHFPLTAKSCLFGRKAECDIRIQLPHVSKEHCKVDVKDKGEVFVTNLSTVNPTQINGTTFKQPVRLKHGDVITIIDRSFRFEKPSAQQGKRRSTGLDSETFKAFASNQSSDTNETVRIESVLTSKTQRKSEGSITRTTHSRRSLQISSSSEPRRDMSPFGELYEMLKSEVKQNGKTPVKDKSRSPKNVALKRSLQIQDNAQTPVAPKRTPRRSQSSDSPKTSPKEVVVERRSASAGRVREASKSPSRSPKTSIKAANESFQGESEQTKRRSSGKQDSQSVPQEQVVPVVNGNIQKRSPRRSAGAEQSQALTQIQSTPKNVKTPDTTPRRRSNQSVPEQLVLKEASPRSKSPTQGRRSASLENVQKGTPNKPPVTEGKTTEGPRQSPRKRRSDELSLPDPPPKRKRVSFGGHLSPELFDKRLPPNSPLKKGATPARRSLSLNSPHTLIRKSFGPKQSVIREVFERTASANVTPSTPASASQSSPSKYSVKSSPAVTESGKSQVSKSPNKPSALIKTPARSPSPRRPVSAKSPDVSQSTAPITPLKNSPAKSGVKTPSTSSKRTSGQKSLSVNSPVKSPSKSPKKTPSKSPKGLAIKSTTPVKTPSPGAKRSPVAKTPSPAKKTPVSKTPSPAKRAKTPSPTKRSKTPSPARKTPMAKTPSPAKKSPVAKTPSPAKKTPVAKTPSPAKKTPVAKTSTPAKRSKTPSPAKKTPVAKTPSPAKTPVAKTPSPAKTPVAKTPSPAKKTPVAKTSTPAKRSKTPSPAKKTPVTKTSTPAKRSKTPSPAKKTPVTKTSTPAKRSKTPSPAKKTPVAKTPSPAKRSKTPSPAKKTPVTKTSTPAKRSNTPSPAKKTPVTKTSTPAKRSKTLSPAKKTQVAKTPSPAKRSKTPSPAKKTQVVKTPSPAKRSKTPSPAKKTPVAKTPSPAKRSKTPSPAKKKPVAKTPTPAKRSKTPTPAKKTPVAKTPTQAKRSPGAKTPTPTTPATPYMKGRFSVSRIDTPPQETVQSELPPSRTPNKSRKSLSMKTPRRSRKLEALELIRSRRRSGATEANLLVSRTWADVVKIGVAKSQKKIEEKPVWKTVATKKKLKHKTPMKKIKELASTGHADSPATILVGRAHTRTMNLTGYVPKVVRNQAVKLDTALNESFTGVAELFSTPVNKQRKSNRVESSKNDTPSSTVVEVSAMQTPEGSGEMVVSPLNSTNTTRRKQYGQDAVSRLLHSPVSPELLKEDSATLELTKEASKSQKNERKSVGLSAVKRIMRTPKQKGGLVTDPHALRKLLRTPKETESPRASSRRSANLEVLGINRLVKTPKQKGVPVENFSALQRIMKTPKQKAEPVEVLTAVKRIMRTPKERVQPVEDMIGVKRVMRTPKEKSQPVEDLVGIKRIMRSPKERGQPVEDMVGIKRIMSTPKERGQPVEDYALNHLMKTPEENVHSAESTRPIEEIFGMRNLIKTPPKPPAGKEVASTDPSKWSANSSGKAGRRGRPSKRLDLHIDSSSGATPETVQSSIVQEVTQSSQEVVKSVQKRGRPSKSQSVSSSELPNEHVVSDIVTSPRRRGRPSSASKGSLSASEAEVTSPTQRGKQIAVTESPKGSVPVADDKVTSPTRKGRVSTPAAAPKESASDAIVEVTPRRKGRQSSIAKESVSTSDTEVTSLAEPESLKITAEASKESASDAVREVTSPRRRGRQSSNSKAPEQPLSASYVDVSSPSRRGRPSSTAKESVSDSEVTSSTQPKTPKALAEAPKESANSVSEVISPRRRGRPSSTATEEALSASAAEVTSPRLKGRQSSAARQSLSVSDTEVSSSTQPETPNNMAETSKEFTSNAVIEVTSPRRSGRPSSIAKAPKESLAASDAEVTSPSRRGRPSSSAEVPKSPVIADGQKTPPIHKKISKSKVASPEESVTVADSSNSEVVSPRSRGRQSSTGKAENPKETVPIADGKVTSPTRRGRPSASAVITESVPSTSPKIVEVLVESLPVSETASPARRGRPKKDRAVVPEESVPNAKSKLTSPTRNKPNSPSGDPSEPVSDSHSGITKDPIPVVEGKAASQTRRGRQKTKVDLPEEPPVPEVQITRGSRSKRTVEKSEQSVAAVDELPITQTRRGRPKASAQVSKAPPTVPEVDVSSPTRGSRSKEIAEAPKDTVPVLNDVAVSQKRRGRQKVAEVAVESAIVSEVAAPTRSSRSKDTANASEVSVPAVGEAQKRRGRLRKADVSKESGAVPEVTSSVEKLDPKSTDVSEVASPTRKGRSRNAEVSKETEPVSHSVTSPKRRKSETTEAEVVLPEAPSEGANEKAAKSSKKTVRQSAKTPSKQAPEPEETLPVAEKKTQLPQRGRRKAAQNEPVVPEGDPNSSSEDKQPEGSTGNASPVARRGGRRRNAEELSSDEPVIKPKKSKQETRRRGQSKSKGLTEENVLENSDSSAPEEPVKSPEPKSPKKSPARQAKDLAIELPVESQPKSLRGRPGKKVNVTEESNVASSETVEPETEAPQKRVPARGRSRTAKDVVNVSASDAGEQTKGSSRASRRNQTLPEDSSESTEEQNKSVSEEKESSARGKRGKKAPDSSEPHSSPEVKGRIAKGRVLKNVEEQTITKSKTKSVQWHPLLDTDIQSTTNTAQDSNEGSPRASRLKGKTRPDASEPQVTAKRSRRGNQAEAAEPPASTNPEPLTVSEDVPAKRGRKANVQKKGEAIDTKATAESTVSTEVVQAIPQRGRRGAPSKAVEIENHNVEPSTSRRQRGVAAKGTPSEENKSTQSPVKSQKGGAGQEKAEEVSSKSTRGVKRKQPNAEVKSAPVSEPDTPSQTSESVLVETENIPAGRGRKNQRNTKTQKVQEALPEKQTVTAESPAKRRKTEAATTAAQKKSSRQTSKLENEKPPAATKTRASTRSRK